MDINKYDIKQFLVKSSDLIKKKLFVEFYQPKFQFLFKKLHECPYPVHSLKKLSNRMFDGPFGSNRKVDMYQDSGIPYIRVKDVLPSGIFLDELKYISLEKHNELIRSRVVPGNILITIAGRLGTAAVFPESLKEGNITGHIVGLELSKEINPHYVATFINSQLGEFQAIRLGHRTTRPELNLSEVGEFIIPVPPRPIQDRIAQIMQNAYVARKQLLNKAKDLNIEIKDYILEKLGISQNFPDNKLSFVIQESQIYSKRWDFEYFDPKSTNTIQKIIQCHWPVRTLGEIVSTLTDGQHGYLKHLPDGIPLLRTTNIFENEIKLHDLRYIAPEVHAAIKRSQLKPGDVLLTTIGSIGIAAVVDDSLGEANINQNLVKLTPQADINPYYLALFLNSSMGRIQTERTASKSVVPIVNYTRLREILIPIPPYSVQEHIAEVMQNSYTHIKHIRSDAENLVIEAKACVERMILGEEEVR
ncbi:restriction endonuclease subunit S [Nostoc sp.]|uniref:restriction endonuclease subunit S n=1 Tax=Nostoc sp. TaxID=1180 RepID=UPI002FF7B435